MEETHENRAVRVAVGRGRARDNDGLHKRRGIWHFKLKIQSRWREFSTRTTNYREARKIRQQPVQAQEEGRLPSDAATAKLEKVAPRWLGDRKKLVARQTWRIDKGALKRLLRSFGHRRLCDITTDDIRDYQLERKFEVGNRMVNLEVKTLRQILRSNKLWARIADDYKPLPENTEGPGRALSVEEEKRLFSTARSNPQWQTAYYAALLAANTTARGCELKGLRLQDVDLMNRTMRVRRLTTKSDAGCRIVPLNDTAMWATTRLLERAKVLGATEPDHYLFPACRFRETQEGRNVVGAGYDPASPMKTWRTAWRNLTRQAGLKGLRFHDLRHHCITRLAEAGVPEQTLMAISGHVSRQMLEHYSHIRMQAKRKAVKAIDSLRPTNGAQDERQLAN